jgi:predicted component of type VI protein secretion system
MTKLSSTTESILLTKFNRNVFCLLLLSTALLGCTSSGSSADYSYSSPDYSADPCAADPCAAEVYAPPAEEYIQSQPSLPSSNYPTGDINSGSNRNLETEAYISEQESKIESDMRALSQQRADDVAEGASYP